MKTMLYNEKGMPIGYRNKWGFPVFYGPWWSICNLDTARFLRRSDDPSHKPTEKDSQRLVV